MVETEVSASAECDLLRSSFKHFKDKSVRVKDFVHTLSKNADRCRKINFGDDHHIFNPVGDVYEVTPDLGFFYMPNPFRPAALAGLLREALTEWPVQPNRTNLDIEPDRPENIWTSSLATVNAGKKLKETWLYKLRWTSLGYHYHWTEKEYVAEDLSPIAPSMARISKELASHFGFANYLPEAMIVNYYHLNNSMGFHVDHAEKAIDKPLISLSLGQPGVYLLGGLTRDDKPVPLLLRHGDIVVMTGRSRRAFHAVPRIVHEPLRDLRLALTSKDGERCCWCGEEMTEDEGERRCQRSDCQLLWQYLNVSRVNINVRQVVPDGMTFESACAMDSKG